MRSPMRSLALHLSQVALLCLAAGCAAPGAATAQQAPAAATRPASAAATAALPNIVIVATGGTIAGAGAIGAQQRDLSGRQGAGRQADRRRAGDLARWPTCAASRCSRSPRRASPTTSWCSWPSASRRWLKQADVDGIVITHGTDTLEETAYFLDLVVRTDKPIVVVGSMRPSHGDVGRRRAEPVRRRGGRRQQRRRAARACW